MSPLPTGLSLTGPALVVELLLVICALIIAPRNRRPSAALAWILLIVAVPVLGLVAFFFLGSPYLPKKRMESQRRMNERIADQAEELGSPAYHDAMPTWLRPIVRLNRTIGAMPMLDGNAARLLPSWDEQLQAVIEAVQSAKAYLHVEFYILSLDDTTAPFFAALESAKRRGVRVHVLFDHLGSHGYPGYRATCRELDRIGVDWRLMLPVQPLKGRYQRPDLRNHRKLMVVDGDRALVGSPNLIDPSYDRRKNRRRGLRWHDLLVEVRGPVVQEVDAIFVTDWHSETDVMLSTAGDPDPVLSRAGDLQCQIAPSGPAFPFENNLALFNSLIYAAERRISITSPYFVPDESLLGAITTAAQRGVAVELFVGAIGDQFLVFHAQHSYYRPLLEAGVRIYCYPAPGILHAKHMSIDEAVAVVGSSNMDIRSFMLDLEVSLLVHGRSFVDDLRAVEDGYRRLSSELTLDDWKRESGFHHVVDNLARLTSAVQ